MTLSCHTDLSLIIRISVYIASLITKATLLSFVYVDDMIIFGTSLLQVKKVKDYLSSFFKMKDMEETKVVLGIKNIRSNDWIIWSQSHYVEKIFKRFDMLEYCPVSTPMDESVKLLPYEGSLNSQLLYSKMIRSLMYAITSIPYENINRERKE